MKLREKLEKTILANKDYPYAILNSVKEIAQEHADTQSIEFTNWILQNMWQKETEYGLWIKGGKSLTDEQILELFHNRNK